MQELFAHLMITAVVAIIGKVSIEFLNFLLRRRVIKSGFMTEEYLNILRRKTGKLSIMKWGIILFFTGCGLVVLGFLPYSAETSPIPWGVEIIFIALGFLVYYMFIRKEEQ